MSEKTIESASAELISTINDAIKGGLDNMPDTANYVIDALVTFYLVSALNNLIWAMVSSFALLIIWRGFRNKFWLTDEKWESLKGKSYDPVDSIFFIRAAATVIGGCFMILFFASSTGFTDNLVKWFAPVGSLLAKHL